MSTAIDRPEVSTPEPCPNEIMRLLMGISSRLDMVQAAGRDEHFDRLPTRTWYTIDEVARETGRSLWQVRKW